MRNLSQMELEQVSGGGPKGGAIAQMVAITWAGGVVGAGVGATVGSAVGPGVGTLTGGAAGFLIGSLAGLAAIISRR